MMRGFSLIEVVVSSTMFITAMLIIIGALISLENASRKVRATRVATDNVSAAIDSMSRALRMGSNFHCGCGGTMTTTQDCPFDGGGAGTAGATCIAFENQQGDPNNAADQYVYRLTGTRIERSTDSGTTWYFLTAPEIIVNTLKFFSEGTTLDTDQVYVTMIVRGTVAPTPRTTTNFNTQITVAQRTPNLNLTP